MIRKSKQILSYKPKKFEETKAVLIRNILVPFDESNYSKNAFDFALDLSKKYQAKLHVVSVMHSSIFDSSFLDFSNHQIYLERRRLDDLSSSLARLKLRAEKGGIPFISNVVLSSSVAETILSYAGSYKADLIVMGTRGRMGSPRHLRIGSVAVDVSQSASCPVIFVK